MLEVSVALAVAALAVGLGWWGLRRGSRSNAAGSQNRVAPPEPASGDNILVEQAPSRYLLRPLPPAERERYSAEWNAAQRRFVDDPSEAVAHADRLIHLVMAARGYPTGDFEQRSIDLSQQYPSLVENYRSARALSLRYTRGESSTEDLRRAMMHFRSLVHELLEMPSEAKIEATIEGNRLAS